MTTQTGSLHPKVWHPTPHHTCNGKGSFLLAGEYPKGDISAQRLKRGVLGAVSTSGPTFPNTSATLKAGCIAKSNFASATKTRKTLEG